MNQAQYKNGGTTHMLRTQVSFEDLDAADSCRRCQSCQARISMYNDGRLCNACSRHAQGLSPSSTHIPSALWSQDDVRQALSARDFGTLCHLLRERSSLRQEDMAVITGLSQAFLSMLEAGVRRLTSIDKIIGVLDGLGVPNDLVITVLRPAARLNE